METMRTLLILLFGAVALAQEFDVASIKTSAPPGQGSRLLGPPQGGPGTTDPTHITWSNASLTMVLTTAYNVKNYQVNTPDWMNFTRFDFAVVVPEGSSKDQVEMMWRNLLAVRFGLKVRIEKKQFDVDELVVGPRGHKLVATTLPDAPAPDPAKPPEMNGPGMMMTMQVTPAGIQVVAIGKAQTMASLLTLLSNQVGHPVVDKTGLTGKYDFTLEFAPSVIAPGLRLAMPAGASGATAATSALTQATDMGADLVGAIQQQMGLKLNRGKGDLDYIVVERAEKVPTEN
jgi:uncharacterized protein (TIGR03435 family)